MNEKKCDCGQTYDLRPYGSGGKWVCFQCGTGTQEALAETERNFIKQLTTAYETSDMVVLSEIGPVPIKPHQTKLH